ncbi:PLAC8 family-domain-containing protein [Podospora didyma]|uniref:PLAC8 family-domain-containing protein n=1 Tax=Podospora didyma TaxID=330526 RepID=A0AAE0N261_9PEZI|nr:PLAC8 family-domain-containing protein [Podospora didyma]
MEYRQQPPAQDATGEWEAGFCKCSPCSSCLLACCCPCIMHGKTADRLRDPTMQSADTFNSDCMLFGAIQCCLGVGFIFTMQQRGEIRKRYGIKGSGLGDCCATFWCNCCAQIQQDNEVITRSARGPIVQGYQPQGVMSPGQQHPAEKSPHHQVYVAPGQH